MTTDERGLRADRFDDLVRRISALRCRVANEREAAMRAKDDDAWHVLDKLGASLAEDLRHALLLAHDAREAAEDHDHDE